MGSLKLQMDQLITKNFSVVELDKLVTLPELEDDNETKQIIKMV